MKVACTVILLTAVTFVVMLVYAAYNKKDLRETAGLFHLRQWSRNSDDTSSTLPESSSLSDSTTFTTEEITAMKQRLSPRELIQVDQKLLPHQFLHLHHMKTGGTSMDGLIQCGIHRLLDDSKDGRLQIPYTNVHECSQGHYEKCRSGQDQSCLTTIQDASILSYCAPVSDLPTFHWTINHKDNHNDNNDTSISAVTVLRHPVQRVWSMYRFRTKSCYQCRTLKEVYEAIDNGQDQEDYDTDMCASQLMNHQTRNLVSSSFSSVKTNKTTTTAAQQDELNQQHVQEAISNLKQLFTMVGLTEDMVATAQIVGHTFPWLAEHVNASDVTCPMPRKNTSPSNNGCGPSGGHMPLPDQPDEETARFIEAHNQLDLQVYEAAVKHFELQKLALGLD